MKRIEKTFAKLKSNDKKGLVTFITAGDPSLEQSATILNALPQSGADFIEIGMPFTDPMADGPAIQDSSLRALANGMSLKGVIKMVAEFRESNQDTPIILMGYFNPIYTYGTEDFVNDAADAGADGLIIVDLPPEEDAELRVPATKAGLDFIKLLTPTTKGARLDTVLQNASGFLYYVSIAGVTGTKSANIDEVGAHIKDIKAKTDLPVAVGFGIKTPEDAANMSKIADAVVVGSSIVQNMQDNQKDSNLPTIIENQVSALKKAI
ncbi:MAG: tryptophan synthase subunit alpha [Micavibrio sp.]|nr:tryptophan synthase subunit alpha [Micavibrio sp.]|tara:strand:+ start:79 stop:873 length:795 start_codon:yes stop_codon:yes gene_type:complete